jgi:hypothetical protein
MDKNISQIIIDACKKTGIDYTSCNPNYRAFYTDAKRLGEIILKINFLIDELDNLFSRHNIEIKLKNILQKDLQQLHTIDHDLIKLSQQIKEENV